MTTVVRDPIPSRIGIGGHPLHPALVHFPVAMLTALVGADVVYMLSGDPFWQRAGLWLSGVGTFGGWAAGMLGLADWLIVGRIRRLVSGACHAITAVMMLSVASLNWIIRLNPVPPDGMQVHLFLSLFTAALVALAGWLGGRLVYEHAVGVAPHESHGIAEE